MHWVKLTAWSGAVLSVAAGVVLGLGGYTFWYAEGGSYFSSDPKACMNCHIMREQYDSWQHSSHHHVAVCNDCHLPHDFVGKWLAKAKNGWFHSKAFTLQDFPEPIQIGPANARIAQQNCLRCHQDFVRELTHHGAFADENDSCFRCHANAGHGARR